MISNKKKKEIHIKQTVKKKEYSHSKSIGKVRSLSP